MLAGPSAISSPLGKSGPCVQVPVAVLKIEVCVVAPNATMVPSGRCIRGPISGTMPRPPLLGSETIVLPALAQVSEVGLYSSEFVPSSVSTTRTLPLGVSAKPSSEKPSALVALFTVVHVKVAALKLTCFFEGSPPCPIMNVPSGNTMAGESQMVDNPEGGFTAVQVCATGS